MKGLLSCLKYLRDYLSPNSFYDRFIVNLKTSYFMAQFRSSDSRSWTYTPRRDGKHRTFHILNKNGSIANPEIIMIAGSRRKWRRRYQKEKKWFTEVKH